MYYTNTNAEDDGYGEHDRYLDNKNQSGFTGEAYYDSQGYGNVNQSSQDFQNSERPTMSSKPEMGFGAYQQPGKHVAPYDLPVKSSMHLMDKTLISAQQSLESWKTVGLRPSPSSLVGAQRQDWSDYSIGGEPTQPRHEEFQHQSNFDSSSDVQYMAPPSDSHEPPRPRMSGGIRTFQPRSAQLQQRPSSLQVPRSAVSQLPPPSVPLRPVRMETSLFDNQNKINKWQTPDSYQNVNESMHDGPKSSGDFQEQFDDREQFNPDMHHDLRPGHKDMPYHSEPIPIRDESPFMEGRGLNFSNSFRGKMFPAQGRGNRMKRPEAPVGPGQRLPFCNTGFGRGASLPNPSSFSGVTARLSQQRPTGFVNRQQLRPSSQVPRGPSGFPVTRPRAVGKFDLGENPQIGFGSNSQAQKVGFGSQTGFSTQKPGVVLKSALKTSVRSLMDVEAVPPTPPTIPSKNNDKLMEVSQLPISGPPPPPTETDDDVVASEMTQTGQEITRNDEAQNQDDEDEVDTSQCKICNIKFEKEQAYHVHIRSTSHHQKMIELKVQKCEATSSDENSLSQPVSSPMVLPPVAEKKLPDNTVKGPNYCHVCSFEFANAEVFASHLLGLVHRQKLEELKKDPVKQIEVNSASRGQTGEDNLKIKPNWGDTKKITVNDFPPDEEGFQIPPYFCSVCDVQCTGEKAYEMHISGLKHNKNLKKMSDFDTGPIKRDHVQRKLRVLCIQEEIDNCREPLIGLDYITEYQMEDPSKDPCYICDLCESKMASSGQVIGHVCGIKHRHKYFRFHGEKEFWILWNCPKKTEKVKLAAEFAAECERREGRNKVRLRVLMTPFKGESLVGDQPVWTEIESDKTRSTSELPGIKTLAEINARYKPVKDGDDDECEEDPLPPPPPRDKLPPSPPRFNRDHLLPAVPRLPYGGMHAYPPVRDPYRPPEFGGSYPYHPHVGFAHRPLDYPSAERSFYNRPPVDAYPPSRSALDYGDRYRYDERDRYSAYLRGIRAEPDVKPIGRPVVVDYNHGAASAKSAAAAAVGSSKQESSQGSERDWSRERDREQKLIESDRFWSGRERGSLERESYRPSEQEMGISSSSRQYASDVHKLNRESSHEQTSRLIRERDNDRIQLEYDRHRLNELEKEKSQLERDARMITERSYDSNDRKYQSREYLQERSIDKRNPLDSDRHILAKHNDSATSLDQDLRGSRSSIERDRQYQNESLGEKRSATDMEADVKFLKSAIAHCNINTEADAELALQISNSLTQALLEYRLNALHRMGKSDPALEQHLDDLRRQNAELADTVSGEDSRSGSISMYGAMAAAKRLASTLGSDSSSQDLIQQVMSVLDAVNKQLYGMLDSNTGSDDSKPAESETPQQASRTQRSNESNEDNVDRSTSRASDNTQQSYESEFAEASTSHQKRNAADDKEPSETSPGTVARPAPAPSKRFRFGL